jgi:hypothetical protein
MPPVTNVIRAFPSGRASTQRAEAWAATCIVSAFTSW